jgi:hypothetical protein
LKKLKAKHAATKQTLKKIQPEKAKMPMKAQERILNTPKPKHGGEIHLLKPTSKKAAIKSLLKRFPSAREANKRISRLINKVKAAKASNKKLSPAEVKKMQSELVHTLRAQRAASKVPKPQKVSAKAETKQAKQVLASYKRAKQKMSKLVNDVKTIKSKFKKVSPHVRKQIQEVAKTEKKTEAKRTEAKQTQHSKTEIRKVLASYRSSKNKLKKASKLTQEVNKIKASGQKIPTALLRKIRQAARKSGKQQPLKTTSKSESKTSSKSEVKASKVKAVLDSYYKTKAALDKVKTRKSGTQQPLKTTSKSESKTPSNSEVKGVLDSYYKTKAAKEKMSRLVAEVKKSQSTRKGSLPQALRQKVKHALATAPTN